uniref:Uncharacterized protein n=1 Tax=Anguilla anguilla TaxID=7936 RepID=A0A0E9TFZ2_ANGAN
MPAFCPFAMTTAGDENMRRPQGVSPGGGQRHVQALA